METVYQYRQSFGGRKKDIFFKYMPAMSEQSRQVYTNSLNLLFMKTLDIRWMSI